MSAKQKVEVYFRKGTRGVAAVTTWNRQLQTDEQIGPCTTIAALKQAYGSELKPYRQGLGSSRTASATSSSPWRQGSAQSGSAAATVRRLRRR